MSYRGKGLKYYTMKIAAIIVTYNRLELLQRCYNALLDQSNENFIIVVVNNGSTDGTKEWLDIPKDRLIVIHQNNEGGAGGFYSGMKFAYEAGYDWMWLMDDDGVPEKKQLQELIHVSEANSFLFANALVCDIEAPLSLSFGLSESILNVKDVEGQKWIKNLINPFNGTLIHRKVIDKIGFIKKEMYIWGDEVEYTLRAITNGINVYTICSAIHFHPQNKGKKEKVFPHLLPYSIVVKPKPLSHAYYRNIGYIAKKYHSLKSNLFVLFCYSIYFLRKMEIYELCKFFKYYFRGIRNDYLS